MPLAIARVVLFGSLWYDFRMNLLSLPRNVQFLYEEHLARIEMRALGCVGWERVGDDPKLLHVKVRDPLANLLERAAYAGSVDGQLSVYEQLIQPSYQGGAFNRTRSVNQYLTHWIYPYRGKFHPQMIRALMNIAGVTPGSVVLDPYGGSGTTALEASLLGVDSISIDLSPLCVLLTRVKTQSVTAINEIREKVAVLLQDDSLDPDTNAPFTHEDPVVADFLKIAQMVTLSDAVRRGRDPRSAIQKNLANMLNSVEAHVTALDSFEIKPGKVTSVKGDARDLASSGIVDGSIDAVITSPPYSIALDYVKNDEHALKALRVSLSGLRNEMTGVRGRGKKAKLALYNEDMQAMFDEVSRVLKPSAVAIFVIGDATVDRLEFTTTDDMVAWAVSSGLSLERRIPKVVYGLYNVMLDEEILVFRKP